MKSFRYRLTQVAFLIIICLVFTFLAGATFNALDNWNLNRRFPVPGKVYTVDGYKMHINCIGRGSPTVVLESGLGNDWLIWQKVQPKIAKTHRVCSYDRAGIGRSDPRPGSRGAQAIAEQLKALLEKAGIHDRLILVGHSAGGLYVRAFAGSFPDKVAGLVFLDAASPELFHQLPSPAIRSKEILDRHRRALWLYFKVATGLSRLTDDYCNPNTSQRIPAVQGLARAEDCRPAYINSWLREWDDSESSAEQVGALSCCNSAPLIILSHDPDLPSNDQQKQFERIWDSVQEQLKRLSSRSVRIIARNSRHFLMVDRPDIVIESIRMVDTELLHDHSAQIHQDQTIWR